MRVLVYLIRCSCNVPILLPRVLLCGFFRCSSRHHSLCIWRVVLWFSHFRFFSLTIFCSTCVFLSAYKCVLFPGLFSPCPCSWRVARCTTTWPLAPTSSRSPRRSSSPTSRSTTASGGAATTRPRSVSHHFIACHVFLVCARMRVCVSVPVCVCVCYNFHSVVLCSTYHRVMCVVDSHVNG